MEPVTVILMYMRYAGTRVETHFLAKFGKEMVEGENMSVQDYYMDTDKYYNEFDVLKALQDDSRKQD